jgi:hypothetical protein
MVHFSLQQHHSAGSTRRENMKRILKKKFFACYLVFFLIAFFFSSCGNNGNSGISFPGDTNTFVIGGSSPNSTGGKSNALHLPVNQLSPPALPSSDSQLKPHAPNQVVVKFEGTTAQALAASLGATVLRTLSFGGGNYATFLLPQNASIVQTIQKLKANPNVVYAEPNWYRFYKQVILPGSGSGYAQYQWAPQDVNAPQVWTGGLNGSVGDAAIVIGIADTGVNGAHVDLVTNVQAGFDYADNYTSPEGAGTTTCPLGETPYSGGGCTIPAGINSDQVGHGTLVASTADANGSNGHIAGVCWLCSIEPIKLFGSNGNFTTVDLEVQAFVDAANSTGTVGNPCNTCRLPYKPNVINMSFGGPIFSNFEDDGINYALQHGIVLVAAAGNSGNSDLSFPAAYPGVIAVSAVNGNNQIAPFSTQGAFVALSAPGVQMYGASSAGSTAYQSGDGTSFASPMVSGAVGLIDSLLKDNGNHPPLTPDQVANLLEQYANKSVLNGANFSNAYGYGLLDVLNAVSHDTTFAATTGDIKVTVTVGGNPACDWDVLLENSSGQVVADTLTGDSAIPNATLSNGTNPPYGQPGVNYAGTAWFYLIPQGTYTLVVEPPKYATTSGTGAPTCGTNAASGDTTQTLTVTVTPGTVTNAGPINFN